MDQETRFITGKQFKDMLLGAYHSFEKNYESINDLNVFPVPDGDTGTNMMHTLASVAKEVSAMPDTCDAGEVGTVAGRAAIMGARGNSGVILSQLLRGIGKGTAGKKVLTGACMRIPRAICRHFEGETQGQGHKGGLRHGGTHRGC